MLRALSLHLRVAGRQAKLCLARDMQYRLHFIGRTLSWLLWTGMYLAFIEVLLSKVGTIAGWGRPQMYVLYGTYMLVDGIAQVCIQPNMHQMSSYVREGSLDLVLTKPIDSQFMVSTARWDWGGIGSLIVGMAVVSVSLGTIGHITGIAVAGYAMALIAATLTLYSLWLISVLLVFKAQRLDGICFLFTPFFQLCRYPIGAYPPVIRAALRTVFPMAFVVTIPAQLLLGLGEPGQLAWCLLVSVLALAASRLGWRYALSNYASASS